jgi:hypothetical protein
MWNHFKFAFEEDPEFRLVVLLVFSFFVFLFVIIANHFMGDPSVAMMPLERALD